MYWIYNIVIAKNCICFAWWCLKRSMQFCGNLPLFTAFTDTVSAKSYNSGRCPRRGMECVRVSVYSRLPLLGMTVYIFSSLKSIQRGFMLSISATLRCRDQLFICFSRVIADIIVGWFSTYISLSVLYREENVPMVVLTCWVNRFSRSDVTPVYNTVFLLFVSM